MTNVLCANFVLSDFLFAFLLALLGVLATIVCVLSLMLASRHKADMKRLERYVYVKETWGKPSDCAKTEKNETNKNATKNDSKNTPPRKKKKPATAGQRANQIKSAGKNT